MIKRIRKVKTIVICDNSRNCQNKSTNGGCPHIDPHEQMFSCSVNRCSLTGRIAKCDDINQEAQK